MKSKVFDKIRQYLDNTILICDINLQDLGNAIKDSQNIQHNFNYARKDFLIFNRIW